MARTGTTDDRRTGAAPASGEHEIDASALAGESSRAG